ncbi:MAG TPA: pyridoxal phosphate-dependent aminotransferase [Ideonella sp.]|nr:pyridoxal phosphate-dependent aminotransferase [Ideonella sp.]
MSTHSASPSHPPQARASVRALGASLIREVANSAMGRADVLPFWFGESDQATPLFIREAAIASLRSGETFYSQNAGRPYLREAIATYQAGLHGRAVSPERIAAVGSGVSGLMLCAQLVVEPGDRVVAVTPLWPNLTEIPRILSAQVERVPLVVSEGRWALDLERLLDALTPDTRLLLINSPNNPTGWTIEPAQVEAILAHCRRHGIWVLADEVYERLVYDESRRSAPSFLAHAGDGDRVLGVNSFSKAWSMTGWRAGWITAPEALVPELNKLIEYNTSCLPEPTQRAAVVALRDGEAEVAALRQRLSATRAQLATALAALPGVEVPDAGGAMYVFFRLQGHADSLALAKRLVDEVGLGLAPGRAFGAEGEGWLRWCHAVSPARLEEGIARLRRFLAVPA